MGKKLNKRTILTAVGAGTLLTVTGTSALALGWSWFWVAEEFDEAEIFFELNDTDGDLGIHGLIDADAWKRLIIEDLHGGEMLDAKLRGRLLQQGLTEVFFESAEPTFDELDPAAFFARFPAGVYAVEGRTLEGMRLHSEAELTHVLPAPPTFLVNGINAIPASPEDKEACEELEELPELTAPVQITFDAVTEAHPELGDSEAEVEILRYQVVAEFEDEDENAFVASVDLQPDDQPSFTVTLPNEFFVDGAEVKFEVLARESSFNQTAVESCPFEFVAD